MYLITYKKTKLFAGTVSVREHTKVVGFDELNTLSQTVGVEISSATKL